MLCNHGWEKQQTQRPKGSGPKGSGPIWIHTRKGNHPCHVALRMLMEKYREGQRELHCVFVDLEKAYDKVPREELWYCIRKSGIVEQYVQLEQHMYECCDVNGNTIVSHMTKEKISFLCFLCLVNI